MAEQGPNFSPPPPDRLPEANGPNYPNPLPPVTVRRRWERAIGRRRSAERERRRGSSIMLVLRRIFLSAKKESQRLERNQNVASLAIELANKDVPNAGGVRKAKRREMSKPWKRRLRRDTP